MINPKTNIKHWT